MYYNEEYIFKILYFRILSFNLILINIMIYRWIKRESTKEDNVGLPNYEGKTVPESMLHTP